MIRPLPLFAVREWGTRYSEGQRCPSCVTGELQAAPICPHCYDTHATRLDFYTEGTDSVHVYECSACGGDFEERGRTRLGCHDCGLVAVEGWHRHHYDSEAPGLIRGRTPVLGELYATAQHYLSRPRKEVEDPFHLADFVIDIDRGSDLQEAVWAALAYAEFLDENDAYYRLFFSGSKGFHLQVPFQALGAKPHDRLNPRHYKGFAKEIQREVGEELDRAIYSRRRMLRVENSFHSKTGLYKVRLSRSQLEREGVDVIRRAKTPNPAPANSGSGFVQEVKRAPPLVERFARVEERLFEEERAPKSLPVVMFEGGSHPPCVRRALEEGPPEEGTRHQLTVNLAAYWVANGLPAEEFVSWAERVPGASDTPKSQRVQEAAGALRWAERNRPPFRCRTMQELGLCDPGCPFFTGNS